MENKNCFDILNNVNVNEHTEKKKTGSTELTYLSWAWAWAEVKKRYPTATYKILRFENNLPYVFDANTGYMVFTEMTIDNITHEMWLPVMDGSNKAMKNIGYTYKTKFDSKSVEPASMFDINKTLMRCLVKNIAMFGLGLYIYAGEDLPSEEEDKTLVDKVQDTFKGSTVVKKEFEPITDYEELLKALKNAKSGKQLYAIKSNHKCILTEEQKKECNKLFNEMNSLFTTQP